jgi:hypothetical protein
MKQKEVKELENGLYKIYWKSGAKSLAAVGQLYNGDKWLAPTNWTSEIGFTAPSDVWHLVKKVKPIK